MSTFVSMRTVRTTPEGFMWEPSERWVRGRKGDLTVVDSRRPLLVWEPGSPVPAYAFPRDDVRTDLIRPAKAPPAGARSGPRTFYDIEAGGEVLANAAWTYPAQDLAGHLVFAWSRHGRGLDHWYEEDEEVFIHPRDPHHRVDALASSRHVRVEIAGTVVADTAHPVLLFETGLPVRYYIPPGDVRLDLFAPTGHTSGCPYKGTARYWSWRAGSDVPPNVVWSYPDPLPAVAAVQGRLAFYNEAVDIEVDGARPARPDSPFTSALFPRKGGAGS
ncbi:DUF427 domain-containing protein [Streptomyces sp. NPDC002004]